MHLSNDQLGLFDRPSRTVADDRDYWLRRSEEEAIAAIRAADVRASASHDAMSRAYGAVARSLLMGAG